MSKIQANSTGTRSIEVSEEHLQTLEKYQLMRDLQESHGYVDEETLMAYASGTGEAYSGKASMMS